MLPFSCWNGQDKAILEVRGGAGIQSTTVWLWEPLPSKGTPGLTLLSSFDQMRPVAKGCSSGSGVLVQCVCSQCLSPSTSQTACLES